MNPSHISIGISILSFVLSATSLLVTYRQKRHQDELSSRKALTDAVAAIAQTNTEGAKYLGISTEEATQARRNLNSQRRYLANHAELLIREIPSLAMDIDHQLIAGAFASGGDAARAGYHWEKCVEKAPNAFLKAVALRGFASFLFGQGSYQLGRQKYEESLAQEAGDNDRSRHLRAETQILWAIAERENGFEDEAARRYNQAAAENRRIGNERNRMILGEYIESAWRSKAAKVATIIEPRVEIGPE